jgi:tetratricopeptide (TPR) repeat protein/DNA-binding winged helix-turn-helix (wHTH) protein
MIPATFVGEGLMESTAEVGNIFRFGLFEANSTSNTLTRGGLRVKIQDQPFQLLMLLLQRPGEVVTREELRQSLWPEGTYVDFDGSLNVILKRLRAALDDDPENPRFIQTVPRRGYRFIAPVAAEKPPEPVSEQALLHATLPSESPQSSAQASAITAFPVPNVERRRSPYIYAAFASVILLLSMGVALAWHYGRLGTKPTVSSVQMRKSVAVLGFQNLSGRAEDAWLASALSEMLSTELSGGEKLRLVSGEDVSNLRLSAPWPSADSLDSGTSARIGDALNSDVLVLGSYMMIGTADQGQLRLDVRMQNGKTGEILTETAEVGSMQDLFRLVSRIGAQLRTRLGVEQLQGIEEAGVLAALPLDPEAARFYSLGVTKLRQFDALAAKDLLEQAAEIDPKFSLVHAMLARAWSQLGYQQEYQEEAKKAFDQSTDLPRAQRLLVEGEYYESMGRQERAASVYHALFELFPDNVEYALRLASAQSLSGNGTQAMEVIRKLRSLPAPSSDDPRIDLAEVRAMKDDKPAALALVRSAMRKASGRGQKLVYALARKEECMLLNYTEHPDLGLPSCEDAFNIFLSAGNKVAAADSVRQMADTLGTQGHYERSIETYQRALHLLEGLGEHEKTGSVLNNMAIAYENEGKLDRAEQLYRGAKAEFEQSGDLNNEVTAMGNIADIYYLRGNLKTAEKFYQEALKVETSKENSDPAYLLYRLADLSLTEGRVQDAHRSAQQAIDSYLSTHGSYQYLTSAMMVFGEALEAQGDLAGARSQFEQTLAIRQKMGALDLTAESQTELAALDIEEGRIEEAGSLIRAALIEFEKEKSDPDSSTAYTLLSRTLLIQGEVDEARKAAQHGADLSLTSSDPALKLPAQIQQARVDMASSKDENANSASAFRRLNSVIATAKRLGYYNVESEARLALGQLELKTNSSLGRKQLKALTAETRQRGYELVARHAEEAMSSGTVVAENRSTR